MSPLSNDSKAKIIRQFWKAMQVPTWTSDDLIDLGKAIYAKTALEDLARQDEAKFSRLLPHLARIAEYLAPIFSTPAPAPAPAQEPTPTPAQKPAEAKAPEEPPR